MTRLRWLGVGAVALFVAGSSLRCNDGTSPVNGGHSGAPTNGGTAGAVGAAGGAAGPSSGAGGGTGGGAISPFGTDHFPKSGQFTIEKVPPNPKLSCGPGCRVAMNLSTLHASSPRGVSSAGLSEFHGFTDSRLMFIAPGDTDTTAFPVANKNQAFFQDDLYGSSMAYLRIDSVYVSIEAMDITTGAYRAYASFDQAKMPGRASNGLALNDTHVFWNYDNEGIYAADRTSGEVRKIGAGLYVCLMCATDKGVLCTDQALLFFEWGGMQGKQLVPSPGIQMWGACSVGRDKYSFIDYRDTPSTSIDDLSFGDVYVLDIASGETTRVTYDAPTRDLPKTASTVDGDLVAWNQAPSTYVKTTPISDLPGGVASVVTTLAFRDMKTGRSCLWDKTPIGGWMALIGRRLYGYSRIGDYQYLVEIDVDDPMLPWKCTTPSK